MKEFIRRILLLNNKVSKAQQSSLSGTYCLILSSEEWQDLKDIMEFVLICTEKAHKKDYREVLKEIKHA